MAMSSNTHSIAGFIDEFKSNNLVDEMVHHFDELLVLYNIFGVKDNMEIYADGNAKFRLVLPSIDEINKLYNLLNGFHYTANDITFIINIQLIENCENGLLIYITKQ